ncbi:MAG: 1-phosphofructokinase family hexose kinase [Clostridia bacterium]|nr:1-phosphofructokinase family hexose kinase [Clostridia bacterium]
MKILTLTLNPAFDIHCGVKSFMPERENYMRSYRRHIGGKGVNVSRALHENGVESTAFVVLGKQNSADFEAELSACGIKYVPVYVRGRIRENITIHPEEAPETRISFEGCHVSAETAGELFNMILPLCDRETVFTFNGRMPAGLSVAEIVPYLEAVKATGACLAVDSGTFTMEDFIEVKPWLIKPNQEEISRCVGREITTAAEAMDAAEILHEKGIENVMVSMGGKGAVLVCSQGRFAADVPKIDVISTIGAGDSSVAGFCAAFAAGRTQGECLREAVSYGSAACLTAGTNPPKKEDVDRIRRDIVLKKIN